MSRLVALLLASLVIGRSLQAQTAEAPATGAPPAATAAAPAGEAQPAAKPPSPEAVAAKAKFDAELKAWNGTVKQIGELHQRRTGADATALVQLDSQLAELRGKANETLARLVDAGLAAYAADAEAYPAVNSTLLFIGQYYIVGDARGDGGDQYEKALALVKPLVDAGAAERWPQLWLWGAVAATCTNDFATADKYYAKAHETGVLGDAPPSANPSDPGRRAYELASQFESILPELKQNWEKEHAIRDAEAKADDLPRVKLTTSKGDVVIELFENEAPQAVANFITLVKKGFYNGVPFHRVLPGFMAQGGDPTGTGSGGPGYSIRCECYQPNLRHHFRGSLSMAHAGRDTGGSQFFLTFVPTSFLDGRHTVFGRVVEGMDVASSLKRRDPAAPAGAPDEIVKAEVLRDRGHEYTFEKLPER